MSQSTPRMEMGEIERALGALTEAGGAPTAYWEGALEERRRSLWRRPWVRVGAAAAVVALVTAAGLGVASATRSDRAWSVASARVSKDLTTVSGARPLEAKLAAADEPSAPMLGDVPLVGELFDRQYAGQQRRVSDATRRALLNFGPPASWEVDGWDQRAPDARSADAQSRNVTDKEWLSQLVPKLSLQAVSGARPLAEEQVRQIIRRANIDCAVGSVRVAYEKARGVPDEARGEYVQESTLSGDDDRPETLVASLVLRVTTERLSQAMNELRGIGKVVQETSGGEDVTDQVVDIEARLRNEQRMEQELLELLSSRKDASLKDVMEVRGALDTVRQQIERLVAQRDKLGRLTALATIRVTLRHEAVKQPSPVEPAAPSLFGRAWHSGVERLLLTVAWVVETAVAGLVVWAVLGVAAAGGWVWRRRVLKRRAREAAPTYPRG